MEGAVEEIEDPILSPVENGFLAPPQNPPDDTADKLDSTIEFKLDNSGDMSLAGSSNASSQIDLSNLKSQSDGTTINDLESKYLEEQANLKRSLEKSESRCSELLASISSKDDLLARYEKDRILHDKERVLMKRENDLSLKEKETAVIRYATLEKKLIDMKHSSEVSEKKLKDTHKEIELLNGKIKSITSEKTRICNMLDGKCHELKTAQKDCEKIKADLASLEMKSKWNLVKLKQEMELKVTAEKRVDELAQELADLQATLPPQKTEDVNAAPPKNIVTEEQQMEQQATLILLKHGNEEKDKRIEGLEAKVTGLQRDLSKVNQACEKMFSDNQYLVSDNDKIKTEHSELQNQLDREMLKVAELQAKVYDFESLKTQLTLEKETNILTAEELRGVKSNYEDQSIEINKLRVKETELLQFNKELTERVVKLQNEISLYNSKSVALCLENEKIKRDKKYYEDKINDLEVQLTNEKQQRNEERLLLTRHISEKTKLYEGAQKKLEHALGDLDAVKKKNSQTVKELNRELMQLRKKAENVEKNSTSSRKSSWDESNASSSGIENELGQNASSPALLLSSSSSSTTAKANNANSDDTTTTVEQQLPSIHIQEPSKKTLIERIVRLQHASARQNEKIDYLENHSLNLQNEMLKKQKLIQYYILRERTGALASSKSDRNKAQLAKYGGVMSAIYSGIRSNSSTDMTLDLSLEINRKLQAVLEDTLLKNITLKDNLDTLGLEIDKLTRQLAVVSKSSSSYAVAAAAAATTAASSSSSSSSSTK